MNELLIEYLI